MPCGLIYINIGSFHFSIRNDRLVFIVTMFPVLNANSVDPDQTPHSAASDLGLHCLLIPFYGLLAVNG